MTIDPIPSMTLVLGLTLSLGLAIAWMRSHPRGGMKKFRERPCRGRAWQDRFPDAPADRIRDFLALVADAFAFSHGDELKLDPDDGVLALYRTIHPDRGRPDMLELETLAMQLKKTYRVDPATLWRDELTLGDLFSAIRSSMN